MNFKKKLLILSLFLSTLFPSIVFAYSNKIILGGENVGIKVNSKNVMVVGFYKVEDKYVGEDAGLEIGDVITEVNGHKVSSIDEMISIINEEKEKEKGIVSLSFLRNDKKMNTTLELVKDTNGVYKTGLYVKDQINGIGTLTYIDPDSKIFGALGHEIQERSSLKKIEVKDGVIFKSEVTGINPSEKGTPGAKEAKFYTDEVYGSIKSNEESGIFGTYNSELPDNNVIEVEEPDNVKLGSAQIRTVINASTVKNYDIEIINIEKNDTTKNILFKITDKELLNLTGGVVAGMSGSPIIQNNKIIGAVTHVVVNDPQKGYGIFITTMLKEGDKQSN